MPEKDLSKSLKHIASLLCWFIYIVEFNTVALFMREERLAYIEVLLPLFMYSKTFVVCPERL